VRYVDVGRSALDFNGDGHAEVAVGASQLNLRQPREGALFVYSGTATGVMAPHALRLENESGTASAQFGHAAASAGDLNGDGFDDLAVGAYLSDRVYVFYGSMDGLPSRASLTLSNPVERYSAFGWDVGAAGDINGDGFADLVVGAQSQDNPAALEGAAYVYYGSDAGLVNSPTLIDSPDNQPGSQFGFSVAGSTDVDGDGYTDLAIGAASYDGDLANQGRAFVFRGGPDGVQTIATETIDNPHPAADAELGRTIAAGDYDGDGLGDIVVGAPYAPDGAAEVGRAYLAFGSRDGLTDMVEVPRPASQAMGWFGVSLRFAGDVDGDGLGDFVLGSPRQNAPSANEGVITILYGTRDRTMVASSARLVVHPSPQSSASFGFSVGLGVDLNGDGRADLAVAAPGQTTATSAGAVFVLEGTSPRGARPLGDPLPNPSGTTSIGYGVNVARAW
jgi:hypothetical protein